MIDITRSAINLLSGEIDQINQIWAKLEQKFDIEFEPCFNYDFQRHEIFRHRVVNSGPAIKITNSFQSFHIAFIQIGYSYEYGRKYKFGLSYEFQTWGIIRLTKNFGHLVIRPESFADKVREFVNPVEIDFNDDKPFSSKYYVTTIDEKKARSFLTSSNRSKIHKIADYNVTIEVLNDILIIGNNKVIDQESAFQFVNFMDELSRLHFHR